MYILIDPIRVGGVTLARRAVARLPCKLQFGAGDEVHCEAVIPGAALVPWRGATLPPQGCQLVRFMDSEFGAQPVKVGFD